MLAAATAATIQSIAPLLTEVATTTTEFRALEKEWNELFRRTQCDNVFLSFQWMFHWWTRFGQKSQLCIVVARDSHGRAVAIAPFYISLAAGLAGIRRLGIIGDRFVGSDYLDVLVDPDYESRAMVAVCEAIVERQYKWDYLEFCDMRSDSSLATSLRELLQEGGMRVTAFQSSTCPYTQLPRTMDAYLASRGADLKRKFRQMCRVLDRHGEVEFVTVSHLGSICAAFEELCRLHRSRSTRAGRQSSFCDGKVAEFHESVLPSLAEAGMARIHLVKVDDKTVAALYGFVLGNKFCFYQSGIDSDWHRFSLGSIVLGRAIEHAIMSGQTEFDFLRGDEPYKSRWASQKRQLTSLRFFDMRPKSLAVFAGFQAIYALRETRNAIVKAARFRT
jgi:CelD/BcsL family acetyltransferase involved in cellulose biosynthesis